MIDYSLLAIPKPGKRPKPEVKKDGTPMEPSAKEKKRIIDELCAEQNWRCYICGRLVSGGYGEWNQAVIEHVIPGKMGGCKSWNRENLKAACVLCNNKKGSRRDYLLENGKAEL